MPPETTDRLKHIFNSQPTTNQPTNQMIPTYDTTDKSNAAIAAAITSKSASFAASGNLKIAVPVNVRDDQFFGPAEPGISAVTVRECEDQDEMRGYLETFLGSTTGDTQDAIRAQLDALN